MNNTKPLILDKLQDYFEVLPDYSIGDVLYSVLTQVARGRSDIKKSDLLKITDDMFYGALDRSLAKERPENN